MPDPKTEENEVQEEEQERSSRLPVILGVVGALALGGAAGVFLPKFLSGDEAKTSQEEFVAEDFTGDRVVHSLDLFTVNLRGTAGSRVLRLEVQVEVKEEELPLVEEASPLLRDSIITLASDYTYAELEGLEGKTRLRDELLGRLNSLLDGARIERVYFTQFVVQ